MRNESLSIHKITQYLLVKLPANKDLGIVRPRNLEELEELKIQGYDWAPRKFSMMMFAFVTTVYACIFLGLFGLSMYFAKKVLYDNFTGFWNGVKGATLGAVIGFAFCQLVILWCAFMKGVVFRARKRGACGRVLETMLVDVRSSLIFNDYRSLHLKFLKKEENAWLNSEDQKGQIYNNWDNKMGCVSAQQSEQAPVPAPQEIRRITTVQEHDIIFWDPRNVGASCSKRYSESTTPERLGPEPDTFWLFSSTNEIKKEKIE